MSKLTADDLIKLASSSKKAKDFVIHLAKVAAGESEFDETPPAMNTEQLEADKASKEMGSKESENPAAAPVPEEQVPVEPAPVQEGPEAIGARAAQSFIGPEVMQAAASGDPGAADLVARTAGQVAGAVTEAALKSTPAPVEQMGAAGIPAGPEGAVPAPAIATPEEELANEIVPPAQAMPAVPAQPAAAPVPQESGEQGQIDQGKGPSTVVNPEPGPEKKEDGKVDVKDVQKLIELAKAGKI